MALKGKELLKDEEVQKFVFMISFVVLRFFAGGYHANSYMYCIIVRDYDFYLVSWAHSLQKMDRLNVTLFGGIRWHPRRSKQS